MNRKVQWLFFDFDGTLVNSLPALYEAYRIFLDFHNITGTYSEFTSLNGPNLGGIIELLKDRHRLKGVSGSLLQQYMRILKDRYVNVNPVEGSSSVLNSLKKKGYKSMLVTSAYEDLIAGFIKHQKWEQYFEGYVFGNEVTNAKPNPEIYLMALSKSQATTDTVIAVEDSPNGLSAACGAGIKVIGVAVHHSEEELYNNGANNVVQNLHEILSLLEEG